MSKESPYRSFFGFRDENGWPDNTSYEGWWDYDTLPKLNYEGSEELYDYILGIAAKWVSAPYYVDGWRLDVAADLGHSSEFNQNFGGIFEKQLSSQPGSTYSGGALWRPKNWLEKGDQWDTVMITMPLWNL